MVADERAQLLLVGAIAIAIILIGMTTVLNSAVFTENVAQGNSVEVAGNVEEFDRETVRNVRSLVVRVNHKNTYKTATNGEDNLRADTRANVSNYSRILAESYADTGSVFVNVTYEEETLGRRLVQDEDEDFAKNPGNGGDSSWTVISDPFRLGWFVMNLDVENVSRSNPVYLELTDSTDSKLKISMQQTTGGLLAVNSSIDGGSISNATCSPQNGRVLLDVRSGTSYTGDCTFNSTDHLQPNYSELEFVDGANGNGKYDIVVNRSDPSAIPGAPPCASGIQEPCRSVAAWSVNFTTYYQTGAIGYEKTHTVEVYDR